MDFALYLDPTNDDALRLQRYLLEIDPSISGIHDYHHRHYHHRHHHCLRHSITIIHHPFYLCILEIPVPVPPLPDSSVQSEVADTIPASTGGNVSNSNKDSSLQSISIFGLPEICLEVIFSFIHLKELVSTCTLVCRHWNVLLRSDNIWVLPFKERFENIPYLHNRPIPARRWCTEADSMFGKNQKFIRLTLPYYVQSYISKVVTMIDT